MIRLMSEADLPCIMTLENELFSLAWKEEDYLYELNENEYSTLWVLEVDGVIAAYAGLWIMFEQAQITTIATSKTFQRKGYGDQLLSYIEKFASINGAETISLEVRVSNVSAQKLYKKHDYITVSTRKAYYSDNHEDAYLMMKGI